MAIRGDYSQLTRSLATSGSHDFERFVDGRGNTTPGRARTFPKGGIRMIMTGQDETKRDPRSMLVTVKGGMLINLGRTYRGERDADLRVDGRAATRRRRQMEKRT